ncbi:MAG: hypothetical protein FD161_622 [Limisphaerales bacterium]|nr:MAG: hypothetical protein FD161_622 [Limisphaerales bacterium]KAG0510227.1 MAG: hypothetical protein E1N63_622 [Limisphaerales bacterium]TXT51890.1 MAG: hypothetical protein FD140_1278 [Limisphaerales bacterium]
MNTNVAGCLLTGTLSAKKMSTSMELAEKNKGPSGAFLKFQKFLRRRGNVNLARLEAELREDMPKVVGGFFPQDDDGMAFEGLAERLLLRYSLAWAAISTQDLPPLINDDESAETAAMMDMMEPHRKQMIGYSAYFPERLRPWLAAPEQIGEEITKRLEALVAERKVSKTRIYVPYPLFQEQSELRLQRDYVPDPAMSMAALWGKNNVDQLLGESRRARFWIDQLVRNGKIGTGKIARLKR